MAKNDFMKQLREHHTLSIPQQNDVIDQRTIISTQ